jgi:excisionase family DNA binding protein
MEPLATTVPNAAAALGIGRTTLYDLIKGGRLETMKVGRRTLIKMDSLRQFVRDAA